MNSNGFSIKEMREMKQKVIKHWEDNLDKAKRNVLKINNIDSTFCLYCENFYCSSKCPISKRTKKLNCRGSGYYKIYKVLLKLIQHNYRSAKELDRLNKRLVEKIEKFIKFLKAL